MDHSNTSRGFTDCSSKANIFQYGSWSLQTANGPKSLHPSQVCLRMLCTIPTSPRVMQGDSPWNPPEKVNMVRQLCHSNLLVLGADGNGDELTGAESHAGDPQDPSQHKEKDFVAPKC